MSATLAGSPGDCCIRTVQHVGEIRGKVEVVAGVETYVSRPPDESNKKIILFFGDVYGPLYVNSQLIMDYWASNGWLVVGLDYFEGDSMQNHPDRNALDFPSWLKGKQERAPVLIEPWVEAIKRDYGSSDSKYVCVGYCFGAPYVCEHLPKTGSWREHLGIRPSSMKLISKISRPLLLSCSEIDHTFPLEARRRAEDILVEKKNTYFIQVFGSVQHGFALRSDPKIPEQKWAREESARAILDWVQSTSP